ncbi:MAG: succinate--CoA ligase, partial [Rhodospirillales bacterium]|nr:succinate--CoA ligase [Rhodospirillales bacterium]
SAWDSVKPTLPVFFSVHGTGEDEAVAMLKDRLDITPYPTMEEACAKAVEAAQ